MRGATKNQPLLPDTFLFQSTLPVRGATASMASIKAAIDDFNPRSPCGERRRAANTRPGARKFQSTLPVRGATAALAVQRDYVPRFQSTLPVRGATPVDVYIVISAKISIHAPRAGSDLNRIHTPHLHTAFQSTLPVRGATSNCAIRTIS